MEISEEILTLLKALVDADRLRILGVLARERASAPQLADTLHLRPMDVLRHLEMLETAGLITPSDSPNGPVYEFNAKQLEVYARQILAGTRQKAELPTGDLDEEERKIVANFSSSDGRLKSIPMQPKKFLAILRHVYPSFESGVKYSEQEVNAILGRFHEDTAVLRRGLVDHQMLARERDGKSYWRP